MIITWMSDIKEVHGKPRLHVFVADWLKTKGLYMLCSVSEDVTFKNDFVPDNVCCLINHVNMPGLRSIREAIEKLKQ